MITSNNYHYLTHNEKACFKKLTKQRLLKQINPELDITTKYLINMYCNSKDKEAFECALMTLRAEVTDRKFFVLNRLELTPFKELISLLS